ncbi:Exodeoxyribonuclease V alpha chain [Blochmannia endosymbiont of Camponotus (Colobopsis) obliquus]|nr:Exodeoxyribonuclease V alpha chain [Blochmannia endosymbiont of Camponotus (Colobopsis) obliquus]
MKKIITTALQLQIWRQLDIQFAYMLTKKEAFQQTLILAITCLSANMKEGHVCLPLNLLSPNKLFKGRYPSLAYQAWQITGSLSMNDWEKILLLSDIVSDGSTVTPLVLNKKKLYTYRMWHYENTVANFFKHMRQPVEEKEEKIINILNTFFPKSNDDELNWQKIALAVAITNQITLIFGGPGTGKTSLIAKLLASLILLNTKKHFNVKIAAPTGKAARKLHESLITNLNYLKLTDHQKKNLYQKAVTLHKLLGIKLLNNQRTLHHKNNQLNANVIVIDEASMIDLTMMNNLIEALSPNTRVIFFGDHCQLSSVEPGYILGDLYIHATKKYSQKRIKEISRLTGYLLPINNNSNKTQDIADSSCFLHKNYRFNKHSGINNLANAINQSDKKNTLKILNSKSYKDISYFPTKTEKDYQNMITHCISGYHKYLHSIQQNDTPKNILKKFNMYKILCAVREGSFGIYQINKYIETVLINNNIIKIDNTYNYIGRPIIITSNDTSLELYNGDCGLILPNTKQKLQAYFLLENNNIKIIPINLLPEHETSFAITVHKSQGSEFNQISLILPNKKLPILTKELFYTALTRAHQSFCLYAQDDIIIYTISNKIKRHSNLINKL